VSAISLKVRPLFILTSVLVSIPVVVLIYLASLWWTAQPLLASHVNGIVACYPSELETQQAENLVAMPDGSLRHPVLAALAESMLTANSAEQSTIGVAAFLPRSEQHAELQRISNTFPDERLPALHLLKSCINDPGADACNEQLIDRVATLDGSNGFSWTLIAQYRHAIGDETGALLAMRRAASVPVYDNFFRYQLRQMSDALEQLGDADTIVSKFDLLNFGLVADLNKHQLLNFCHQPSGDERELATYCLAMFEAMTNTSGVMLHEMIGLAAQEAMHEMLGDEVERERVLILREELHSKQLEAAFGGRKEAYSLSFYDQELSDTWLENLFEFGERFAFEQLLVDAREKSADPEYQPCDPPSIRFEFPHFYVGDERLVL